MSEPLIVYIISVVVSFIILQAACYWHEDFDWDITVTSILITSVVSLVPPFNIVAAVYVIPGTVNAVVDSTFGSTISKIYDWFCKMDKIVIIKRKSK